VDKTRSHSFDGDDTCQGYFGSDSKAVTVTIGGQQDNKEDTVTAVSVGQVPAAQQLHGHMWVTVKKKERFKDQRDTREGISEDLENTVI